MIKTICCFFVCAVLLSSCNLYVMPTEDDMTTMPTTNNPNIISDTSANNAIPGIAI
ncbi:MAG: hypothetical protein HN411_01615 [Waddliaceae bacterium]|nr:hypothetical protein [Waddliaceae bacterium]MBT3578488.1 hypothetical protein [Waddliaceae bacterium]MBT4444932.1 hypothetical protein [Waddliaceae bacterium]MBT6927975.1 hypothetical protein [Waddliaceae bacterium]MBT7263909.1 hypothetical protein [Waddliaceae bacterium]